MRNIGMLAVVCGAFAMSVLPAFAVPQLHGGAAQVEKEIRAMDASWMNAAKTGKVGDWTAFYAPNAVVLPPNEQIADTPAKINKSMAAFLALPDLTVVWTCEKVEVSKGLDMAFCYGHYKVTYTDKGKTLTDTGKNLEIWRKQPSGKWLCVADTWNTDLPAGS